MTTTESKPVYVITMHTKETEEYLRIFNIYFNRKSAAYSMAETIEKERGIVCYVHELI